MQSHPQIAQALNEALASDRELRKAFFDLLRTADEVVAREVAYGSGDDEFADDLVCEMDWKLNHELEIEFHVYEMIRETILDDVFHRTYESREDR